MLSLCALALLALASIGLAEESCDDAALLATFPRQLLETQRSERSLRYCAIKVADAVEQTVLTGGKCMGGAVKEGVDCLVQGAYTTGSCAINCIRGVETIVKDGKTIVTSVSSDATNAAKTAWDAVTHSIAHTAESAGHTIAHGAESAGHTISHGISDIIHWALPQTGCCKPTCNLPVPCKPTFHFSGFEACLKEVVEEALKDVTSVDGSLLDAAKSLLECSSPTSCLDKDDIIKQVLGVLQKGVLSDVLKPVLHDAEKEVISQIPGASSVEKTIKEAAPLQKLSSLKGLANGVKKLHVTTTAKAEVTDDDDGPGPADDGDDGFGPDPLADDGDDGFGPAYDNNPSANDNDPLDDPWDNDDGIFASRNDDPDVNILQAVATGTSESRTGAAKLKAKVFKMETTDCGLLDRLQDIGDDIAKLFTLDLSPIEHTFKQMVDDLKTCITETGPLGIPMPFIQTKSEDYRAPAFLEDLFEDLLHPDKAAKDVQELRADLENVLGDLKSWAKEKLHISAIAHAVHEHEQRRALEVGDTKALAALQAASLAQGASGSCGPLKDWAFSASVGAKLELNFALTFEGAIGARVLLGCRDGHFHMAGQLTVSLSPFGITIGGEPGAEAAFTWSIGWSNGFDTEPYVKDVAFKIAGDIQLEIADIGGEWEFPVSGEDWHTAIPGITIGGQFGEKEIGNGETGSFAQRVSRRLKQLASMPKPSQEEVIRHLTRPRPKLTEMAEAIGKAKRGDANLYLGAEITFGGQLNLS